MPILGAGVQKPTAPAHRTLNALAAPRYHCGACGSYWIILGPPPVTCEFGRGQVTRYQVCKHAVALTAECGQCS